MELTAVVLVRYVFALAFSLTWPSVSSTEYSTFSQLVLLADLFGLFLDEGGEGIDVAGDVLAGFFLGSDQSVVEALDLLALGLVDAVQGEGLGRCSPRAAAAAAWLTPYTGWCCGLCSSSGRELPAPRAGILRTAIAFFADAGLLAPQVAVNGIALGHFVVAVALGEVHAAAVGKLAQQA